jgi:anti-sigma B factor antagonist/stage II sporulation protein AA (anti-sigma F factor antagonist)
MQIDCRVDPVDSRIVVASLFGHLNEDGTERVWQATSSLLDEGHPSLVVDLGQVDLLTSAGLGTLVRLHHRVHKLGGRIALFGASSRVRDVIDIVMLTDILNLCATMDEARNRVSG